MENKSRGKTADKNYRIKDNLGLPNNQFQGYGFRNSAKPTEIEKNFELARIQSQNVLNMSPFGTKNSLKLQQSLTKFP